MSSKLIKYLVTWSKAGSQQDEKNLRSDEQAQNLGSRDAFIDYGA